MEKQPITISHDFGMLMLNIISVISRRGGFIPEEFKAVGELNELLKKELKVEDEKQKQDQQQQQQQQQNTVLNS